MTNGVLFLAILALVLSADNKKGAGLPTETTFAQSFSPVTKNKIELSLIRLEQYVVIEGIKEPIPPKVIYSFNITYPGTFEISSSMDDESLELNLVAKKGDQQLKKFINQGTPYDIKFFFMKKKPKYSIQAEFALVVNREDRLQHAVRNSRSDRQYRGVRIQIDRNHLVDTSILEDF